MAEHIKTYTGLYFYPAAPDIESIRIRDIAHALSLLCRGNGQVTRFWSVGQHCICCAREAAARGYSDRIVLACLIHDASECYLSDVPRPFKKNMPAYRAFEEKLLDLIYEKYLGEALCPEEKSVIKAIDDDMLYYDLTELLNEPQPGPEPKLQITLDYRVRPFAEVEQEYLALFEYYRRRYDDQRQNQGKRPADAGGVLRG